MRPTSPPTCGTGCGRGPAGSAARGGSRRGAPRPSAARRTTPGARRGRGTNGPASGRGSPRNPGPRHDDRDEADGDQRPPSRTTPGGRTRLRPGMTPGARPARLYQPRLCSPRPHRPPGRLVVAAVHPHVVAHGLPSVSRSGPSARQSRSPHHPPLPANTRSMIRRLDTASSGGTGTGRPASTAAANASASEDPYGPRRQTRSRPPCSTGRRFRCRPRMRWPTCGSSSACLPALGDDAPDAGGVG